MYIHAIHFKDVLQLLQSDFDKLQLTINIFKAT